MNQKNKKNLTTNEAKKRIEETNIGWNSDQETIFKIGIGSGIAMLIIIGFAYLLFSNTTPTTTTYSCIPYAVATNPNVTQTQSYANGTITITITITNANAIAIENLYIGSNSIPYQTSSQKLLLIANETDGTYIIILQNQTLSCLPNG